MGRFEKYSKWLFYLAFVIITIAVYKTFDNFHKILDAIKLVWTALSPFVTGFIIAYIFNMPCRKIRTACEKSKYRFISKNGKPIAILSVYLIAFLLLFIVIRSVVPALYKNLADLYNNVPKYFEDAISAIVKWQAENDIRIFEVDRLTATDTFNNILGKIDIAQFSKYAQGVVKITSGVINFFIGIIVSIYMLIEKEKIIASAKKMCRIILKKDKGDMFISVIARVNVIFSKYIFCLLVDALVMAVLSTVILSLLKVRYAIILGILIGTCNLIPYFGAIIAVILSVVITLLTGGMFKAIWTAVALLLLQQADGNFIGPKIMGQMLNISPLWIIFAVTLGGGVFGVGGMVVSVPLFMVIKMLISEFLQERETASAKPLSAENKDDV